ncbi:VOC family protein [Saccharothrix obliqua]|uniref:VOC family protein n=1 Tax=Saccharothrix obliqua TaxID=2861747 RepID=UPI001C5E1292|nr:VOC family protein [Saccharothrix obliqua]MBW4720088.1 VOC family protein [Saccharothrix obliqua]
MTLSIGTVHVLVDDTDAALTFYRDALGLTVRDEVEQDGLRWVTLTTPAQPDVRLVLSPVTAGRSPQSGEAMAALLAKGELGSVNFRTDDLDATFAKVAGAPGVEVLQEPLSQPWGARDAAVRDPAGNHVRIEQG